MGGALHGAPSFPLEVTKKPSCPFEHRIKIVDEGANFLTRVAVQSGENPG